ncbi:helix-turn-helix domain-containing protein [Rhodobacterales bacterium HKCCE2091]|nr:helix-turn-helix domain-containing protein [Rhodobacterales bacterium HKCCE2091]
MDKTEHLPLSHIPMRALSLRLARSPIRMSHPANWRIDKVNPVHDLVICLTGRGVYQVGEPAERLELGPGEAMLIPAYTRFRGAHGGGAELLTGVAQHFQLELFGRGDVVGQMALTPKVRLSDWDTLAPLVAAYRDRRPVSGMTLQQHHQFMVMLLSFLEDAFTGWHAETAAPENHDPLSMHIMNVAARLSSDPLGGGLDDAHAAVPYNADYFRRAFRDRMGMTPQKFRELKRMEFAANRLGQGMSVKAVAAELGYSDPYFFSRMFKRHMGASPSSFRERRAPVPVT